MEKHANQDNQVDHQNQSTSKQNSNALFKNTESTNSSAPHQLQRIADDYVERKAPIQKKEKTNNTGLPDQLKTGIESLSGYSMDDVSVHYNSKKPAQLQAHAFAQGNQIHLAPGQEKHLAHEAWHVVQQKQGRVKPTRQLKAKININDDEKLEKEADVMGAKTLQTNISSVKNSEISQRNGFDSKHPRPNIQFKTLIQLNQEQSVIQRVIHLDESNEDLDSSHAMNKLTPLLKFTEFDNAVLKDIDTIVSDYDRTNKSFLDIADLAVAVEFELNHTGKLPDNGILVSDDTAEIISNPDFQKILNGFDLSGLHQQKLAEEIMKQALKMDKVYKQLSFRVKERKTAPEELLKWFTTQTKEFATSIIVLTRDFFGRPNAPLSILIAGSGARDEMFPGSDLDLAAMTDTDKNEDVEAIFEFMQKVEKILQITVAKISNIAGTDGEIGLGPDTGVFGFRMTPESLAEKALGMQNTGQDASPLISTQTAKDGQLDARFFATRSKVSTEDFGLNNLLEILREFNPPQDVQGVMNIKSNFLRFPTLAIRDLSQVFGLKSTSSFDRIREIARMGYIDKMLAAQVIEALNTISGIRLQLHVFYGKEVETFAVDNASKTSNDQYVLTDKEKVDLEKTIPILNLFHEKLVNFVSVRKNRGMFTSKSIK